MVEILHDHAQPNGGDITRQAWMADLSRASAMMPSNNGEKPLWQALDEHTLTGSLEGGATALVYGLVKPMGPGVYMRPFTGALVGIGTQVGDELLDRGLEKAVGAAFGPEAGHLMRTNDLERIGMTVAAVAPGPLTYKAGFMAGAWLLGKVINYFEDHH